ncbi:MAG TPA: SMC-Scp complex subunit ScpB [Balneolaceae bacterium]|nr:SMC-Scp complex subunit ScpB [Balneolaceae bacterium]
MDDYQFIDGTRLSSVIEAFIFTSTEPIGARRICDLISQGEENLQLEPEAISSFVDKLNKRYEQNGLSFYIIRVAGGYTFATRKRLDPWLSIIQHEEAYRKLSQSAIETLAIVAYKQPITKPEVDDIRGVDSGYILRQLLEKVLVEVSGRLDAPGRPLLYETTDHFLKHFGINSIDELPKPREIKEILKDNDMAEHRQFLIDRQLELEDMEIAEDENDDISLLDAVKKLDAKGLMKQPDESNENNGQSNAPDSTQEKEEE